MERFSLFHIIIELLDVCLILFNLLVSTTQFDLRLSAQRLLPYNLKFLVSNIEGVFSIWHSISIGCGEVLRPKMYAGILLNWRDFHWSPHILSYLRADTVVSFWTLSNLSLMKGSLANLNDAMMKDGILFEELNIFPRDVLVFLELPEQLLVLLFDLLQHYWLL